MELTRTIRYKGKMAMYDITSSDGKVFKATLRVFEGAQHPPKAVSFIWDHYRHLENADLKDLVRELVSGLENELEQIGGSLQERRSGGST